VIRNYYCIIVFTCKSAYNCKYQSVRSGFVFSQNHRMFGVGRDLCGSSSPTPLPKQGLLQQAAQDLVQAGLECLQRGRLHNLPGQPIPVLRQILFRTVFLCTKVVTFGLCGFGLLFLLWWWWWLGRCVFVLVLYLINPAFQEDTQCSAGPLSACQ